MTEISADRLAACKAYCHVDFNDDDALLRSIMLGCSWYLSGAGVERAESCVDVYDLILHAMTLEIYDSRGAVSPQQAASIPLVRGMLTQMKLRAAYGGDTDVPCG